MGRIIGIDLGTTYSAMAIPEERPGAGFLTLRQCTGHSVIQDQRKRRITPSVVAEDKDGKIVVGYPAKGRVGLSPDPVMFAKRYMGEEKAFQLDKQGVLQPVDVSMHILRYLKELAEERLGETVDEAVITVPAYFSFKASEMTKKAGEMAGMHVAQIAQEPVAAALMYFAGDPRQSLRIMTYDLGGGTFDVAILERRDGLITTDSIRAFDGDRFLGGYDFDKTLALWIMDQLWAQGYDLNLDPQDLDDRVTFAKLLVLAENTKIALSGSQQHQIRESTAKILDHRKNPVTIDLTVTREQFEAMIFDKVDDTIQLARRAMENCEPAVTADQIDEIIMVGGSSYIPLIGRRLEEAFGRVPRLVEPNLCVALGASIIAGTIGVSHKCLKLDAIPRQTAAPDIVVSGRIVPGDGLANVAGCRVALSAADESYGGNRTTNAKGRFAFENVKLAPESTTNFTLEIRSSDGRELVTHSFVVQHTQNVQGRVGLIESFVSNIISKPIAIRDVDGIQIVAKQRQPLPYTTTVNAKTVAKSDRIVIPIYQENTPLGEIIVDHVPPTVSPGSVVEITLTIEDDFQIKGRAFVPSAGLEGRAEISIPVRPQKSVEELWHDHKLLAARADDVLEAAGPGALFGDGRAKRLKHLLAECDTMINGRAAEPAKIQDRLDEIEGLIRKFESGWKPEPPREVFDAKADAAESLIQQATRKDSGLAERGYDVRLKAIRSEADDAYQNQKAAEWTACYEKLGNLHDSIQERLRQQQTADMPQDPATIKLALAQQYMATEREAQQRGKYVEHADTFQQLDRELRDVDAEAPTAMVQLSNWYMKFSDLQRQVQADQRTAKQLNRDIIIQLDKTKS